MKEFRTSLLREKFTIKDPSEDLSDNEPVIAMSNRMKIDLESPSGKEFESFVVRTQNMHSCVRMAAAIAREFQERGPITKRVQSFRWQDLWHDIIKGYEKDWNPGIWCSIYHEGKPIFESGEHHLFLDIIEQCDHKNKEEYEHSIVLAENVFKKAGKIVKIEHDANVALILSVNKEQAKCGVIVRGANKTTTFNFTAKPKDKTNLLERIPTILMSSAAFLEGIQLAFYVGLSNKKRAYDLVEKYSDEDRKIDRATRRLLNLNKAIQQFEQTIAVYYRPDRPNLNQMVTDAEEFSMTLLKPQIEEKIRKGEIEEEEWIE